MVNTNPNYSIFFVGHFAIDTIIRFKKENQPTLGGSVTFGSLALREYSDSITIQIISNVGVDNFDKNLLVIFEDKNILLEGIKYSQIKNTNFVLDYHDHSRTLTLKSRSPDLEFKDIPRSYLENHPKAIVLVPLCGEISLDFVKNILKTYPEAYIGIDAQGFLRKIDEAGIVSLFYEMETLNTFNKIIQLCGERLILKGSEEEMKILSGKPGIKDAIEYFNNQKFKGISIMTLGEKGSLIAKYDQNVIEIPAYKPENVADETGAGDVYLSIFMYEFILSDKSWDSIKRIGHIASAAASFLVEKIGPKGFRSKQEVIARIESKKYITND